MLLVGRKDAEINYPSEDLVRIVRAIQVMTAVLKGRILLFQRAKGVACFMFPEGVVKKVPYHVT